MGKAVSPSRKAFVPSALTLAEEAVHLLRRHGATALAEYYIGSLPFVLGLLFFWADMSRNPYAQWYCAPAAAGVALLFIWMKLWHVRFCRRMWTSLQGLPAEGWPLRRILTTALRQAALHATGFMILPAAALIVLPLAWAYAFYQNVSLLDGPEGHGMRRLSSIGAQQAGLWPGQNHLLLLVFLAFAPMVFLNLGVVIFLFPYLLRSLLGIETILTLSGHHVMNTTFLAAICALTYICVDPILKTSYVLRCYYGLSRHTGDDMRAALKFHLRVGAAAALLYTGTIAFASTAEAQQAPQNTARPQEVVQRLDAAIENVLQQREFTWRIPREEIAEVPEKEGPLWPFFRWIGHGLAAVGRTIDRWIRALTDWLADHLPKPDPHKPGPSREWAEDIRLAFYALGGLLGILMLILLWRWWRRSRSKETPLAALSEAQAVDITDEDLTADELPVDGWLAAARELMGRQDFRGALRALYLAVLALLADHDRLVIARYKSNRDYFREFARRAQSEPELTQLFDHCISAFERVWYGMHPVERPQVEEFAACHERMAVLVRQ